MWITPIDTVRKEVNNQMFARDAVASTLEQKDLEWDAVGRIYASRDTKERPRIPGHFYQVVERCADGRSLKAHRMRTIKNCIRMCGQNYDVSRPTGVGKFTKPRKTVTLRLDEDLHVGSASDAKQDMRVMLWNGKTLITEIPALE